MLSHGSALHLAGLSERTPCALDVTVPHGYNPCALFREYSDVKVHRGWPNIYELGIIEVKSPGGAMVRAYWAERAGSSSSHRGLLSESIHSLCATR